jgi:hypothetical protein
MSTPPAFPRLCYAAAHVVMKDAYASIPHSVESPGGADELAEWIDWETTLSYRRYLDSFGFGIAEAMDTAQRFSLGWDNAYRLISECGQLDLSVGMIAGAGVDHLPHINSKNDLIDGVVFQAKEIQKAGGDVIILPMAWLTEQNSDAETYVEVYQSIIDSLDRPLFIHWLGEMFAPQLAGYFPGKSFFKIMDLDPSKIKGAKLSLLDANFEMFARARLHQNDQILLTGDDFNFASLILGDDTSIEKVIPVGSHSVNLGSFSHALLGIFDGIAEPVSRAMQCLTNGDESGYINLMEPCEALGQCIFQDPTQYYKSGLAFLSWLKGRQDNAVLLNHEESMRPPEYYEQVFALAVRAGAIPDLELAEERMKEWRLTKS